MKIRNKQGFRVELQVSDGDKIGTRQGRDRDKTGKRQGQVIQGNDRDKIREGEGKKVGGGWWLGK